MHWSENILNTILFFDVFFARSDLEPVQRQLTINFTILVYFRQQDISHLDRYFHHYVAETKLMAFLINARKIINEKKLFALFMVKIY